MLWDNEYGRGLLLSVYIITFVAGFPTNVFAFLIFIKKTRQRAKPINILLLNLTVSDLLFLLFLPFKMQEAVDNKWNMPEFLCPLSRLVFFGTIYNSTLFLTGISVERYLSVAFPIKHILNRRPLYAVVASVFIWVISMGNVSIVFIMHYFDHSNCTHSDTCFEHFSSEQLEVLLPVRLELFLVLFCVPFLICSFCYINFVRILSQHPTICRKKRFRAIGLALGTLLVFIICFAPFNLSHALGFAYWESPVWRDIALLTSTFNSCLDPLIFYFSSSTFRGTSRVILKKLVGRMEEPCCCHKAVTAQECQDNAEFPNDK